MEATLRVSALAYNNERCIENSMEQICYISPLPSLSSMERDVLYGREGIKSMPYRPTNSPGMMKPSMRVNTIMPSGRNPQMQSSLLNSSIVLAPTSDNREKSKTLLAREQGMKAPAGLCFAIQNQALSFSKENPKPFIPRSEFSIGCSNWLNPEVHRDRFILI